MFSFDLPVNVSKVKLVPVDLRMCTVLCVTGGHCKVLHYVQGKDCVWVEGGWDYNAVIM